MFGEKYPLHSWLKSIFLIDNMKVKLLQILALIN